MMMVMMMMMLMMMMIVRVEKCPGWGEPLRTEKLIHASLGLSLFTTCLSKSISENKISYM